MAYAPKIWKRLKGKNPEGKNFQKLLRRKQSSAKISKISRNTIKSRKSDIFYLLNNLLKYLLRTFFSSAKFSEVFTLCVFTLWLFPKIGGSQKGGFQKGGFGGCSPGTKTGTRVLSPKPPFYEIALLSPNDTFWCWQKGGFQKGGFGGCSPGTKTGTRVRSPKPPFYETALLSPSEKNMAYKPPLLRHMDQQLTYGVVREGVIAENFPQISAKFPQTFRRISAPFPGAIKLISLQISANFPQNFRKLSAKTPSLTTP